MTERLPDRLWIVLLYPEGAQGRPRVESCEVFLTEQDARDWLSKEGPVGYSFEIIEREVKGRPTP